MWTLTPNIHHGTGKPPVLFPTQALHPMRYLALFSLCALVACADAPQTPPEDAAPPTMPAEAAPPAAEASPEPAPEADLGTFLRDMQAAASSGDAAALGQLFALNEEDQALYDEYYASSLLKGGDAFSLLMEKDVTDISENEAGGAGSHALDFNFVDNIDGEQLESLLRLNIGEVDGEYRVVGIVAAG